MIINLFIEIAETFMDMAPYLLLGLTFAGILHVLFKKEFIIRHLGQNSISASIKAAVLGVPLPLCSCGVIPTALSLRKSSASEGATVSFLISTPQTGVDSIIATYGMLGPVFAIFRPFAALIMGIVGGIATSLGAPKTPLQAENAEVELDCKVCPENGTHGHTIRDKIMAMIKYAYGEFLDDISVQLIVGIVIAGIISYFVPPEFFTKYVNNDFVGMLLMIVAGIPLYVCATASIPIAASLMMKGLSPGAAFVFLAVGPATNAAAITLIANVMGKRIVVLFLSVISLGAIASGFALNFVYQYLDIDPAIHIMKHHHEDTAILMNVFSIIFLLMLAFSVYRKLAPVFVKKSDGATCSCTNSENKTESVTIRIEGMTCNHCVNYVTEAIKSVDGVESVQVSLQNKNAEITGDFSLEAVKKSVTDAGYSAG
jgi:uncharacterized membrane protein YraQ (UPF0718 family)/copper chaperone CopZ